MLQRAIVYKGLALQRTFIHPVFKKAAFCSSAVAMSLNVKVPTFALNTGAKIPAIGMGCWRGKPGLGIDDELEGSLRKAIEVGYRHFDTAAGYQNEDTVGKVIRESGVPREEFFITTKLKNSDHHRVAEAIDNSLNTLGVKYIDLYLMHWPQGVDSEGKVYGDGQGDGKGPLFTETWQDMIKECYETGKAKAIGVSNFSEKTLTRLLESTKFIPAANQIDSSPYHPDESTHRICEKNGIHITNYSPFGAVFLPIPKDPVIEKIARKHAVASGQVIQSWIVYGQKHSTIPKSANPTRMQQNLELVQLSSEEIEEISSIHRNDPSKHTRGNEGPCDKETGKVFGWTLDQLGWEIGFKNIGVKGIKE